MAPADDDGDVALEPTVTRSSYRILMKKIDAVSQVIFNPSSRKIQWYSTQQPALAVGNRHGIHSANRNVPRHPLYRANKVP